MNLNNYWTNKIAKRHMKNSRNKILLTSLACAFLVLLSSCNNNNETATNTNVEVKAKEEAPALIIKYPLTGWLMKNPAEIGCMLEQELAYKDSVFNCSYKNYVNKGDPCKNIKAYYEGVVFPNALAAKVDSS
jgi:hypothetical protein